ncbi:isoprenyl transferase [Schleiferilactobacillus shenzhenensis]|uniref:Isoprenyl transferase n=1 Tax=Schleiferilactobacillus shenzhenensis LY-73 TaxID=1231336 RepID=U4TJW1_9LACO|nr:isoprenyl transferase [Schleiferilactobacillus shenzhenensis]ERL64489.1 UppS [Schleiferilactobacillus shenzhenensis LY-73]
MAISDNAPLPQHIAIIMDGNGRWAKARHLPRVAGHKEGMDNVKRIAIAASHLGVKVLTVYAFSTENWRRPTDEVSYLMSLPVKFFNHYMPDLMAENVKVEVMGYLDELPAATKQVTLDAMDQTKNNTGMILNFAFNYGARREITTAVQQLAAEAAAGTVQPAAITEQMVADRLFTAQLGDLADPDLLIRTSGEERLSNFLLWQLAYSEFVFTKVHWPDFTSADLEAAIATYQHRQRRYGGLTTTK